MNLHERAASITDVPPEVFYSPNHARKMAALIAEMDARIRELTVDAERYRWLRDKSLSAPTGTPIPFQKMRGWVVGPELDAEIDAARKEQTT